MVVPTMRDRMRPAELLGLSAVFGAFAGLVVLMTTRDIILALIFFGVAFILSVVIIAMLVLAMKPNPGEKIELAEQDDKPN
ncbi:hypothetical protein GCM10027052_22520 [Parafrigoribacterium mesophilum]|uniref:hypothetical protein n=1 Tax=Parafrigoribacterium mesophilum TaxID=433646 RepID=UPI0031FBF5B1